MDIEKLVDVAESWVAESHLLPWIEAAQKQGKWSEAERLLHWVLRHTTQDERTYHSRIRGFLAEGLKDQALEEAALVFCFYRERGRFPQALQVARAMRKIVPQSPRPYELEIEYLLELGWQARARQSFEGLVKLCNEPQEKKAAEIRFDLLLKRPQQRLPSRFPQAWTLPPAVGLGEGCNLPALLDDDMEQLWGI